MKKKNKKKVKKVLKEKVFDIRIDPIGSLLIVACLNDTRTSNLIKVLKSERYKHYGKWVFEYIKIPEDNRNDAGYLLSHPDTKKPIVLVLSNIKRKWPFFELLIHELHHLVENISENCLFSSEKEFKAYLIESLFRKIRKELQ